MIALVAEITDLLADWFRTLRSGVGDRTDPPTGAAAKAVALVNRVMSESDPDLLMALLPSARGIQRATDSVALASGLAHNLLLALNTQIRRLGLTNVRDIESYALAVNTAADTAWRLLLHPAFALLYTPYRRGADAPPLAYAAIIDSSVHANSAGKLIVGTGFTDGAAVDANKYAGGYIVARWNGVSGSGTLTVSGTWRKPNGTTITGDATLAVSDASGGTGIAHNGTASGGGWTLPEPNLLLLDVTNITATGLTAGTITISIETALGRLF